MNPFSTTQKLPADVSRIVYIRTHEVERKRITVEWHRFLFFLPKTVLFMPLSSLLSLLPAVRFRASKEKGRFSTQLKRRALKPSLPLFSKMETSFFGKTARATHVCEITLVKKSTKIRLTVDIFDYYGRQKEQEQGLQGWRSLRRIFGSGQLWDLK